MAKQFTTIQLDHAECRKQIEEFKALLAAKADLSERHDIQPFFRARPHLATFIGTFLRDTGLATEYAFEYPILGDFTADLVVGDKSARRFSVIEFEDGRNDSIFRKPKGKSSTEYSSRFEHGFSQIVDWFYLLDDFKKTDRFKKDFGTGHIRLSALLIIGREAGVSDYDRVRLDWRTEKVRVDSHTVECVTFDDLAEYIDRHLFKISGH